MFVLGCKIRVNLRKQRRKLASVWLGFCCPVCVLTKCVLRCFEFVTKGPAFAVGKELLARLPSTRHFLQGMAKRLMHSTCVKVPANKEVHLRSSP